LLLLLLRIFDCALFSPIAFTPSPSLPLPLHLLYSWGRGYNP
jgi:hypothetical protein